MLLKVIVISIILVGLFFTAREAFKPQKKRTTNKYL